MMKVMYCPNCKTEPEGNFCTQCDRDLTQTQPQPNFAQPPQPAKKKKKPFFLRWWFILLVIIVIGIVVTSVDGSKSEKIVWSDMSLGTMLPEPPVNKGKIYKNSDEELWVVLDKVSDEQFGNYVYTCKGKGFTVDGKKKSGSYSAYNADGYKLGINHHSSNSDMTIKLSEPLKMKKIKWPASKAGKMLPTPKSQKGWFAYEYDDNFFVYIGNTSKSDYDKYVEECSEKGFDVDFSKGDDYYYADNSKGRNLSVSYLGNKTMSIDIDAPSKDDDKEEKKDTTKKKSDTAKEEKDTTKKKPVTTEAKTEKSDNDSGDLDPDFKAAMDCYENFMNDYVDFMKKYSENRSNLEMIADYADYMKKYADFIEDFEEWKDKDLSDVEMAYYIDVQARVNKKLLEVAN